MRHQTDQFLTLQNNNALPTGHAGCKRPHCMWVTNLAFENVGCKLKLGSLQQMCRTVGTLYLHVHIVRGYLLKQNCLKWICMQKEPGSWVLYKLFTRACVCDGTIVSLETLACTVTDKVG